MNDQPEPDSAFHARCSALSGAVSQAEVAELRKDKERIDWLEDHDYDWRQLEASDQGFRVAVDVAMNWKGSTSSGYGRFWTGQRHIPAHWFLLDQYPAPGLQACHKCDNKRCVRPSHIFIGTQSENMMDCSKKKRLNFWPGITAAHKVKKVTFPGSKNANSKLTEDQAKECLICPRIYGEASKLAKKLGVSVQTVSRIRDQKRWCHITKN